MGRSRKTIFRPKNPEKYVGNASNIICRSNWERTFCEKCDANDNIVTWASEEFSIPYVSPKDNKRHRYYPDFLIKVKEADGKFKKYVIEIKPKKQTIKPKMKTDSRKRPRMTKSFAKELENYAVNLAKWNAAIEFCKDNSLEFQIITEDILYGDSQ
tara:strand:+ start:29 stop:496 length:468 start_codon:yes stop_codon:yes gene_type:complete